jgi:hypothetical protein
VLVAPIRGVDLFVGLILHQMGEKGAIGWGCYNEFYVHRPLAGKVEDAYSRASH